jgi:hypothetical protein
VTGRLASDDRHVGARAAVGACQRESDSTDDGGCSVLAWRPLIYQGGTLTALMPVRQRQPRDQRVACLEYRRPNEIYVGSLACFALQR